MSEDTCQCRGCQETKPLTEFRFIRARPGHAARYHRKCKACEASDAADRFQRNGKDQPCRSKEARQEEKRRAAERAGRVYRTAAEIAGAHDPEALRARRRAYDRAHQKEHQTREKERDKERRKKRLAEQLATSGIREYRCRSQQEFDDIRMSFAPWLRFPDDDAMQYRLRYALDSEFRWKEVERTAVRRTYRPDWTLSWKLRRAFQTQAEGGTFSSRLGIPSLQEQSLEEQLGYSLSVLRRHIEGLMTDGMAWQQYLDAEVVIDHIKPICRFDMQDRAQFLECWSLSNLQPLTARANQRKSRRDRSDD